MTDAEVKDVADMSCPVVCEAEAGDVVAMKALTIHGSDAALKPSHRRVLHVDYCICALPEGLQWALDINSHIT